MAKVKIGGFTVDTKSDWVKTVVAFIAGKNHVKLGQWLISIGKAMQTGGSQAVARLMVKSGLKIAGVAAAAAFAYGTVQEAIEGGKWAINQDDKSAIEKAWNFVVETSIPKATIDQLVAFGRAMFRKPKKDTEEEIAKALAKIETGRALTAQGQALPYQERAREAQKRNDAYAASHDMVPRPSNPQAANEWEKEVERRMNGNNPGWYKDQGKLMDKGLIGSPNFYYPRGSVYASPISSTNKGLPGVFMISYTLNWGGSEDDYRELSFDKAVQAIKAKNRYSTSYTTLDVAHLMINTRLMYALFATMKRAYRCLLKFKAMDKNLPYGIFGAFGLDYKSWQAAAADIRNDMQLIAAKIKALPHVNMTIIDRTLQLFENVYKDDKVANAQYYVGVLRDYQYFWDFTAATPAYVSAKVFDHSLTSTATGMTYQTFKNAIVNLINKTTGAVVDEITASFSQALGTWYPKLLDLPGENEVMEFTYNPEILMQFENTQLSTGAADQTTSSVTAPADGSVLPGTLNIPVSGELRWFNFHHDHPSFDDMLVASRAAGFSGTGSTYYAVPTEIPAGWRIYYIDGSSTNLYNLTSIGGAKSMLISASTGDALAAAFWMMQMVAAFDWAPHISLQLTYTGSSTFTNKGTPDVNVDWAVYTKVNDTANDSCKILHDLITYGNYNLFAGFEAIAQKRANKFNLKVNETSDK